jgi:hypothetical protein
MSQTLLGTQGTKVDKTCLFPESQKMNQPETESASKSQLSTPLPEAHLAFHFWDLLLSSCHVRPSSYPEQHTAPLTTPEQPPRWLRKRRRRAAGRSPPNAHDMHTARLMLQATHTRVSNDCRYCKLIENLNALPLTLEHRYLTNVGPPLFQASLGSSPGFR